MTVREADVGGSEKSRLCGSEKSRLVMVSVMVREADRVADHSNRVLLRNGSHQCPKGQWPWVTNTPHVFVQIRRQEMSCDTVATFEGRLVV